MYTINLFTNPSEAIFRGIFYLFLRLHSNSKEWDDTMHSKRQIFEDITQIMKKDYAGFLDKKHINCPENYLITNDMTDKDFVETIKSYLLDFKDGHLSFKAKKTVIRNRGFKVRRYQNALYVTEVTYETRLQIGDEILEMDGLTIEKFESLYSKILEDPVPERQYWNVGLRQTKRVLVNRNDDKFILPLATYERSPYEPSYVFKKLDNKTMYLKITDFSQAEPILNLLNNHKNDLDHSHNLIIDVRVNYGGNDLFYFPILNYVFDREIIFRSLFHEDELMYTNYTDRNCLLWIKELKEYLTQELDDEMQKWIQEEITTFETNYAKGLMVVPEELDYTIQGQINPKNVYVLTDVTCGSSGDTFVQNVKKSAKVTVVGRPTMGIMDFFNVVTVDYDDYEFVYSISKMHEKYHYNDSGVKPHIYIPWTPQHLQEDIDLNYVLRLCHQNQEKSL
ncbi:S41 family peptidase [Lysinibacillus sp. NPDC097214]|uniref:S41 family peptidase n=1 Tax=Lysinibacillus sp. NPDC097214 TaxID=3390584 RepID=UPI003D00E0A4